MMTFENHRIMDIKAMISTGMGQVLGFSASCVHQKAQALLLTHWVCLKIWYVIYPKFSWLIILYLIKTSILVIAIFGVSSIPYFCGHTQCFGMLVPIIQLFCFSHHTFSISIGEGAFFHIPQHRLNLGWIKPYHTTFWGDEHSRFPASFVLTFGWLETQNIIVFGSFSGVSEIV